MAGHSVILAASFVESQVPVLPVDIRHGHAERRAEAGEGKNQEAVVPDRAGPRRS